MGDNSVLFALGLSLFAGLSTGLGGLFVLLFRRTNPKYLSVALGFSAGVMIYVSFVEIYPEARSHLVAGMGEGWGTGWSCCPSFGDRPDSAHRQAGSEFQNPHEARKIEDVQQYEMDVKKEKLMRTSIMTAIAISIQFPEGLATFVLGIDSKAMGIIIAIAVAIHNIPEG